MTSVISHQNCGDGQGMRRDHHVQLANGLAGCHKLMPDFSVEVGRLGVPGQHPNNFQKLAHSNMKSMAGRKTLQAVEQLGASYHRYAHQGRLESRQLCFHPWRMTLDNVARNVRVEHVKHAHCSSAKRLRSRGGRFIGRSVMNSSGTLTERIISKKSRHTLAPGRSDNTTSPVRSSREAKISSASNRNSAGKRTAYSGPFLK